MVTPSTQDSWRTTIDGWVRDESIRRHGLLALAMLLAAVVVVIGFVSGTLALGLQSVMASGHAKVIAGGVLGAGGVGSWLWKRQRTRRRLAARMDPVVSIPASNSCTEPVDTEGASTVGRAKVPARRRA